MEQSLEWNVMSMPSVLFIALKTLSPRFKKHGIHFPPQAPKHTQKYILYAMSKENFTSHRVLLHHVRTLILKSISSP